MSGPVFDAPAVRAWIDDDVDPGAAEELATLLARAAGGDDAAAVDLADRFSSPLTFGTAGLRGPLRAGPNGMNRTVVRRAAAGLAAWLDAQRVDAGSTVVVGYDARYGSRDFAYDSAAILSAAGYRAQILPGPLPTPVLAFAVRRLNAVLGIMVTASHNPAADNGYKVYVGGSGAVDDGAQIVPPVDAEIEAAIRAVGSTRAIPMSDAIEVIGHGLTDTYVREIADVAPLGPRHLSIVHTAMHGVGSVVAQRVLGAAGFLAPTVVPEQAKPDPDFPTVAFPNPEEPGALDLALALAQSVGADIVLANDPDADRCAVAAPIDGQWRMLRGDEVGALLADDMLRRGVTGTYATTIVSSTLLRAMTTRYGVGYRETLTGFKWISRSADDLVFGYEEALGYAVAPTLVRDKDGISAGVVMASLAARLKAQGQTLGDRLAQIAREYGVYATDQISVRVEDLSIISGAMARLRSRPPAFLLDQAATAADLLPDTDAIVLRFAGGRVVVRPSGTEPKLKAYLEVVASVEGGADSDDAALGAATATASERLHVLRAEMTAALGL
ncbi:MAG: phosphomannomutase [Pseudonocardiales bacterium]|nr:phosphomannomutase [Pseudonocardiales bacterium]